jgi:hypothetical protein
MTESKTIPKNAIGATKERIDSLFELKGFGFKLPLKLGTALYIFAPKIDSAFGMKPSELSPNGLRGHEGILSERVTFLRFADNFGDDGSKPLIYRYQDEKGEVREKAFGVGAEFFSVGKDGKGFFHLLGNTSERSLMILIEAEKKAEDNVKGLKR